jgi:centrosomal protein CEP76
VGAGDAGRQRWLEPHTLLAQRHGGVADHACLLASLLLGFGLDAYVAYGSRVDAAGREGEHAWVVTLAPAAGAAPAGAVALGAGASLAPAGAGAAGGVARVRGWVRAVFWEPLSGARMDPGAVTPGGHTHARIGCLFRHDAFYATVQPSDAVVTTQWELRDPSLWRAMDAAPLARLPAGAMQPLPLAPPSLVPAAWEAWLEAELATRLAPLRAELLGEGEAGAAAPARLAVDAGLSFLLAPALAAYEHERLTGTAFGVEDFAAAVQRAVPEGHTFKALPLMVDRASPTHVVATLRAAAEARDILAARGDDVAFGLRVRVVVQCEDFVAVWVMLAVRGRLLE